MEQIDKPWYRLAGIAFGKKLKKKRNLLSSMVIKNALASGRAIRRGLPINLKLSYFVHFDEVHNNQRRASFFPIITRGN